MSTSPLLAPVLRPPPSPAQLIDDASALPRRFAVTVIGDVRIDVATALRSRPFTRLADDHHEPAAVRTGVGGTAMSFARAAVPHFEQVRVLAAIGDDQWNPTIWETAHRLGVDAFFEEQPDLPNGLVVIVRDPPTPEHPAGVRLLLAQEPSPYDRLDTDVVTRWAGLITTSDAVVIDGYALLHERSAAAVDLATDLALRARVPVCFDLVPHRIDERVPAQRIWPFLRRSSLGIAEAPTLARLQGLPLPEHPCARYAADLVSRLEHERPDRRQTWFVRFGVGMMEETVAVGTWHQSVYYHTGYAREADGSGFGYRVAAAELKWWLANAAATRR